MKNYSVFNKYYNYMQSVTPRLIEAEKIVDEIKKSPEWVRAFNYFQTLYNRGQLRERPTQANGYKILAGDNLVRISEIEDLLTEEQLEVVRNRALTIKYNS